MYFGIKKDGKPVFHSVRSAASATSYPVVVVVFQSSVVSLKYFWSIDAAVS